MSFLDFNGLTYFWEKIKELIGKANGVASLDSNGKIPESEQRYCSKEVIYFSAVVSSFTMASVGSSIIDPAQVVYVTGTKKFVASASMLSSNGQAAWTQVNGKYKPSSSFGTSVVNSGVTPKAGVIYYDESTGNTYEWQSSDLVQVDYSVDSSAWVKKIYFNMSSSLTSPNNSLSHDIAPIDNKVGFLFGSPLVAMYKTYTDPTDEDRDYIQTIQINMLDATSSRDGYMTSTQAGQLSSLYSAHNGKTYLPLSGGTVTGNVTVTGKTTTNGLVLPVNYYAKYEGWLTQTFINDFGGEAECSFQTYTSNGDWKFVRQTKANVDTADGTGDYAFIVCQANKNMLLGDQRTTINYSDGSITTPKVTQTSDERLKENISSISEDLDKIKEVDFFEFNLKDDENKTKSYGVIAQDLEKVGLENLVVEDDNGYKAVDYTALIMLELQRQRKVIAALEKRLAEIEKTWSWK